MSMPCACGAQCQLGIPASSAHKCPDCRRFIHAICGVIIRDCDNEYNNRRCFDCNSTPETNVEGNVRQNKVHNKEGTGSDSSSMHSGRNTILNNSSDSDDSLVSSDIRETSRHSHTTALGGTRTGLSDESLVDEAELEERKVVPNFNLRLQDIRAKMTIDGARKNSQSKHTFYKNGLENERFLMWLFNHPVHQTNVLKEDFILSIEEAESSVIFPPKFQLLPPDKRHEKQTKFLDHAVRQTIKSEYLGPGGTEPFQDVVNFDSITPEVFGEYLCEKRKKNGGLLKPGSYKGMRSGLSYLFKRYKCHQSEYFMTEVSEILAGVKQYRLGKEILKKV